MTSAPLDEVIRVATVIDTMIDEAVMVGGMTTALVLLAAMMTMNDEATAAVAGVNEMTAMVVALASTDMKAADATTTMGQVVIDEEVGAMNAEMIVSEAMVAHRLPAMMLLVSPMVVVETILLGTIDMPGDKRHGPKGPAILHYAQPTRRVSCFAQASQFAKTLSLGARLFHYSGEKDTIILGANGQIGRVKHLGDQFRMQNSPTCIRHRHCWTVRLSKDGRVSLPILSTVVFSIPCFCHTQ